MKRIFTFSFLTLSLLFISLPVKLQAQERNWNRPYFDINMGGTWQTSDLKPIAGFGWGLGFGKWYLQNEKRWFDIGWHFRYLEGNTYGMDYTRSFGIKNNLALNGTNNIALNYAQNNGYVFHNYKMHLSELAIELLIGANKLREKTNIILYGWGGVGLTRYETKLDQLDALGNMYNYSLIDSSGNKSNVRSKLRDIYDGKYETVAEGSNKPTWTFMPSAGVGLGYRFSKGFSMGFEYKTTWALHDKIDGQQWNESNVTTGTNDKYHYGGVFMRFTFGKAKTTTSSPNNNPTHTDPTVYKNPDNRPHNDPTYTTNPTGPKPIISILNPPSDPSSTNSSSTTLTAKVLNIKSTNDLILYVNGNRNNSFSYNSNSKMMVIIANLIAGNNNFIITATNAYGSDTKSTNIVYNTGTSTTPGGPPPVVTITVPNTNPYNTNGNSVSINATVINVNSGAEISVQANGRSFPNFSYNISTKQLQFIYSNLLQGSNNFTITASNKNGSDTKTQTVIYTVQNDNVVIQQPPVITITQPWPMPCVTTNNTTKVVATITNIASKSNISMKHNGNDVYSFTFDVNSKQLVFNANLAPGSNIFIITATNTGGSDTKSTACTYNPPTNTGGGNGGGGGNGLGGAGGGVSTGGGTTTTTGGGGRNNNNSGGGGVSGGGTTTGGGRTNTTTGGGTASGGMGGLGLGSKPVIALTNPSVFPYSTQVSPMNITATMSFVNSVSDIVVKVNGTVVPNISFSGTTLTVTATLNVGSNTVDIIATNVSGTETKSFNISYQQANKGGGRQGGN